MADEKLPMQLSSTEVAEVVCHEAVSGKLDQNPGVQKVFLPWGELTHFVVGIF